MSFELEWKILFVCLVSLYSCLTRCPKIHLLESPFLDIHLLWMMNDKWTFAYSGLFTLRKNPLLRVLLIQLRRSQVLFVDIFIKLPPSVCCTFKCKVPFPGKVLALAIFGLKPSPKPEAVTKKTLPDENLAWEAPNQQQDKWSEGLQDRNLQVFEFSAHFWQSAGLQLPK